MRIVLALSGGMDSSTLLAHLIAHHHDVFPVTFKYGSKHNPYENEAAQKVASFYGYGPLDVIDLTAVVNMFQSNLLEHGGEIPEGHYAEDSMKQTVVPARNTLFIAALAGYAESWDMDAVAVAVHSGDHHIYPDCRTEYIKAIDTTIYLASDKKVEVIAPFVHMDKTSIITLGSVLMVPYHLTRTCYKDQPIACGKCGSCVERLEAFEANSIVDPVEYE
jgi:7-cyano-7-deazaguanine synthase